MSIYDAAMRYQRDGVAAVAGAIHASPPCGA